MVLPDDIVIAARDGDLSTVQTWLESEETHDINDVAGADLPGDDVWSVKGRGLLHLAALCHGRQERDGGYDYGGLRRACDMVEYLVAHGANVNQRDAGGEPPLHLACGNALTTAVYVLIRAGADPDGASTANAPLYWLFNGILQLADNERGDRDTGEVLQDMCTCMGILLRAGAAIDFFHVAEGCGDPTRGLEDVILEVMYSPWADVENLPQRTFICPPDDLCREYDDTGGKRFLCKEWDGRYYAVEVQQLVRPGMAFRAHPKNLGSLNNCLDLARTVRASMYPSASSRLTPWRQYVLAPRLELLRLRSLVAQSRASSKLKRSLPSTAATRDKSDRKFDCKTNAGIRDALAQTAQTKPAPSFIIPPPRQGYSQRPLSTTSVAAMRHVEWLMAPQTPKEIVWRVLKYWENRRDVAVRMY